VVFPFVPVIAADHAGHRPESNNTRYPNSNSPQTGIPRARAEAKRADGTPGLATTMSQERERK
jgi:hypothetical protein